MTYRPELNAAQMAAIRELAAKEGLAAEAASPFGPEDERASLMGSIIDAVDFTLPE